MSHRARLEASFKGLPVDRTPVTFWQHFPRHDHTADLLAAATIDFQRRFDLDLVKLMPTGMYSVVDYGVQIRLADDDVGTTEYVAGPVRGPSDWTKLPPAPPDQGVLSQHVEVVRQVRTELGPHTPIVQTIFSPLTMASKLVGGHLSRDVLAEERSLHQALERLAADVIAFGQACLQAGADGYFFATQLAHDTPGSRDVYERLGIPYDLMVLEALRPHSRALVLHLHGADPLFDLADRYPIDAVSWEDRETRPSLAEALHRTSRCLMGGIGRMAPLVGGTVDDVEAQVRSAIAQTRGRRLIVAPGCVVPLTVPERNLRALRTAVDRMG
jgi:uroporphyrinogen decarboxylase